MGDSVVGGLVGDVVGESVSNADGLVVGTIALLHVPRASLQFVCIESRRSKSSE